LRTLLRLSVYVRPGSYVTRGPRLSDTRVVQEITSFCAEYSNVKEMREIGECVEEYMQPFEIDGAGGEFVREVEVGMSELPKAVLVRTKLRTDTSGLLTRDIDQNESQPHR
jgi:hypothetical protein